MARTSRAADGHKRIGGYEVVSRSGVLLGV
jgi:hypothetical protein